MAEDIMELGPDTFDKTIKDTKGLLLVYFYGPYCGQCMAFNPIFESVVSEIGGKVAFAKVNMFEHTKLAEYCGVRGTPTLIIYKAGKECDRQMGAMSKENLLARLESRAD
jgi:thioredoxin